MSTVLPPPTPLAPQQPATPAPAPSASTAPALAVSPSAAPPDVYPGDWIAMKVWFGGAAILAFLLVMKELAAVLLPR
jgi:hypothetical protein